MIIFYFIVVLFSLFTIYIAIPWIIGRMMRFQAISITNGRPVITFDDGPDPIGTPAVLDILKKHNTKGIFFVVGKKVETYPGIFARIINEGHMVGYHSYSHRFPWLCGPFTTYNDMKMEEKVQKSHSPGMLIQLYRPPYGKFNLASLLLSLFKKRRIMFWTIDPRDYDAMDAKKIYESVLTRLQSNSVVLFHDGGPHFSSKGSTVTAAALDMILNELGFRIGKKEWAEPIGAHSSRSTIRGTTYCGI